MTTRHEEPPRPREPRLRIAHVLAPGAYGGLERVVSGLSVALARAGHRVVVVVVLEPQIGLPSWLPELEAFGVVVEVVRAGARAYLTERRAVRRLWDAHRIQVVHTHGYRADLVHGASARRAGLRVISTVHGFTGIGWRDRLNEWLQLRALRRYDGVIAVSTPLRHRLERAGIARARIAVIPNRLLGDPPSFLDRDAARAALGVDHAVPVVGWVGRLSVEKAPELLVEALAQLRDSRAVACLIGDGPRLAMCRQLAAARGLGDRVHLPGAIPGAGRLLRAFDALALTSRTEGTPMVLLEAATAGVPVIATAVGGVPELLGEDAVLVASGDASGLAQAIGRCLADHQGAAQRARALAARIGGEHPARDVVERHLRTYAGDLPRS